MSPASDPTILGMAAGSEEAEDDDARRAGAKTLLVTGLPDLSEMAKDLDEDTARRLTNLHDRIVRTVMKKNHGRLVGRDGGYQMLFEGPVYALSFALAYFRSLEMLSQGEDSELTSGVGIHHGTEWSEGRDIASKLASLAGNGQILLTREALDLARSCLEDPNRMRWLPHGSCEIEGLPEPLEIFEVLVQDPTLESTRGDVETILGEALELDPDERREYLARTCRGDDRLLREVESLIRADEQAGDFLARPILEDRVQSSTILSGLSFPSQPLLLSWLFRGYSEAGRPTLCDRLLVSDDEGRFALHEVVTGRYRIVDLLGQGGMGEVYRAEDLKLGEPVALKFLPESMARDEEMRSRFLREVKIARRISHPNVCRVYDVGEMDGHLFLSMELIDGEDLASLLERAGPPGMEEALTITRQVCHGLAAAHHQGVLHRDLKPANLMVGRRGRVRITDFGLAGLAGSFSRAEARHGTPAYMAPEQHEGREVSVRTDLYALGLVIYELVTGRRPFEAESPAEMARLHRTALPKPPSERVTGLDPALESTILHCLEKRPGRRPSSVKAVIAALKAVAS